MRDIEKLLFDIEDSLLKAEASYQIWFGIKKYGLTEHRKTLNRLDYVDFFHASIPIFLQSVFMNLSKIFDRAEDLSGLKAVKAELAILDKLDAVQKIEFILERNDKYIKAIKGIRDQSIGHRKTIKLVDQIYDENPITPDQIKELICELKYVIQIASDAVGRKSDLLKTDRYTDATIALIKALV